MPLMCGGPRFIHLLVTSTLPTASSFAEPLLISPNRLLQLFLLPLFTTLLCSHSLDMYVLYSRLLVDHSKHASDGVNALHVPH